MDRIEQASPIRHQRSLASATVAFLALVLLGGTAFAACSGAHDPTAASGGAAAMATMGASADAAMPTAPQLAGAPGDLMPADASEAWAARPAFTRVDPRTEEAYAYALYHPQVVQWMPCYCGCGGMGHRSNLDCYIKPQGTPGEKTRFEEHASYCEVCVETTLLTKQMISEGRSLREIRQAVDETFGGTVPGTPTELPPA